MNIGKPVDAEERLLSGLDAGIEIDARAQSVGRTKAAAGIRHGSNVTVKASRVAIVSHRCGLYGSDFVHDVCCTVTYRPRCSGWKL